MFYVSNRRVTLPLRDMPVKIGLTAEEMLNFGQRNTFLYFKFQIFYKVSLVIDLEIDFFNTIAYFYEPSIHYMIYGFFSLGTLIYVYTQAV